MPSENMGKNILIGVCGLGNGHAIRQEAVATHLLELGHRVTFFGHGSSYDYLKSSFPDNEVHLVSMAWLPSSSHGLHFSEASAHPLNADFDLGRNLAAMGSVVDTFGGAPDIIITDYEAVSAQLSYASNTPLVTIDNQSITLGFECPNVAGHGSREETSRLGLLFPRADLRLVTTCFKWSHPRRKDFQTQEIPPILRENILRAKEASLGFKIGSILVYLSPFENTEPRLRELIKIFGLFHNFNFSVFCVANTNSIVLPLNVRILKFSDAEFLECLCNAEAVISTAGHSIISELIYLQKPMLLTPFNTYEQLLNASRIEELGLGQFYSEISEEGLARFLAMLNFHRSRFCESERDGLISLRWDGGKIAAQVIDDFLKMLKPS